MSSNIGLHTGLRGFYKIEAVRPDGSKRLLADWFPNLVTDNGLNLIGATAGWLAWCSVGSGSTAPATTDTGLTTYVGSTSTKLVTSRAAAASAPYYGTTTITYQFAAGVATGNLSEVGVGIASGGLDLFSHALILDGSGNPTTITVLSTEALDVTYQLQLYASSADVIGSVTINGVAYAYTWRASNVTNSNEWAVYFQGDQGGLILQQSGTGTIGAVTTSPAFTSQVGGATSVTYSTYGTGNFYIDTTFTFGLSQGNATGGLNAFFFNGGAAYQSLGAFQCGLATAIPKDSSHTLTLTFRHSWGRYP